MAIELTIHLPRRKAQMRKAKTRKAQMRKAKTRKTNSVGVAMAILCAMSALAPAQWLDYPSKGIPRKADGKADLSAPAPRLPNGKPDLSGLWVADDSRHLGNLAVDTKDVPFLP